LLGAATAGLTVKSGIIDPVTPADAAIASPDPVAADRETALPGGPAWPHARYSRPLLKSILREAAIRHHIDPKLVLALSYWESGWDQSRVSENGAVGLMQVEPYVAADAGLALLGRPVDIDDPFDNADVGVAILREDLETFGDIEQAIAAYYQGPTSLRTNGMLPDTEAYVAGVLSLMQRIDG
jgi:soluble lytic murein transglycosylase-like protein